MPHPLPLLLLLLLLPSLSTAAPRGLYINCGAVAPLQLNSTLWLPDYAYTSSGRHRNLSLPSLLPTLATLRSFPLKPPARSCFHLHIYRSSKYLLRVTFFSASDPPPVFDLLVDGTFWTVVNTTADYEARRASYYELVYVPKGVKTTSVCVAANEFTVGEPFVSSIEFIILEGSVYNSTDFGRHALGLLSRTSFGATGDAIRYPDDKFDRLWQPYIDGVHSVRNLENVSVSGFWNLPPSKIFETSLVSENGKPLILQWPLVPLRNSSYYIALYFLDSSTEGSRVLDVFINGIYFYKSLRVPSSGVTVFSSNWTLSGPTSIQLVSSASSDLPPLISGGEIFGILKVGETTHIRDVTGLLGIKNQIQNPPSGWEGDPCSPKEHTWVGITCTHGPRVRVTTLNLTSMGLNGNLSPSMANLTALSGIFLGNNSFSGPIPDLSRLRFLEKLHLQDNQISGKIPPSLGELKRLQELFLQNNRLTGTIPPSLNRTDLNIQTSGNKITSSPTL